jgi:hypothetical protein
MTKQRYEALIIGSEAGPPLARRLSAAVSEVIQMMLEVFDECSAA